MRKVKEWIGKTDDSRIPESVRDRIWERSQGLCGLCGMLILLGDAEFDHVVALCNGGAHRESNLRAVHPWCHRDKTKCDLSKRAKSDRKRRRHVLGKRPSRRPLPGSKASGWKKTFNHGWVRR